MPSNDTAGLREQIAELTRSKGQTIDNDTRILVPVVIDELLTLITQHTASVERQSRIDELKLRLMFDPNDTSPEFDELLHKHGTYEAARLKQLNSQGDTDV